MTSFTATTTSIPASSSPVPLTAENDSRIGASVTNASPQTLYVLLGSGVVSSTLYTVLLNTGDYYEIPFDFVGPVTGVWPLTATGSALWTEFM